MMTPWANPQATCALFSSSDTGAIELDPMLPPRRYWVNLTTKDEARIGSAWFAAQEKLGNAAIVTKAGDPTVTTDKFFVMWDVPKTRLMPWPQTELGFPQIADPQTATKRSEVDRALPPDPPSIFGSLGGSASGAASSVSDGLKTGAMIVAVLFGGLLLLQASK